MWGESSGRRLTAGLALALLGLAACGDEPTPPEPVLGLTLFVSVGARDDLRFVPGPTVVTSVPMQPGEPVRVSWRTESAADGAIYRLPRNAWRGRKATTRPRETVARSTRQR